ncbi:MAG: chemotaxis-specific protein-glutamate methyltransferase CheB [Thermoguttaceae bacterium]|jgi:two-component system response regulator WspF
MRIAIVNDLRTATEVLRRVVYSHSDYSVAWTAANGEEAVRQCEKDPPDCILMDLLMPGMNGAEATRQIMQHFPCPILVVTATVAGNYSLVCEALGYGAFDAVSTPVLGNLPPAQAGAPLLAKLTHVDKIRSRIDAQAESSTPPIPVAKHLQGEISQLQLVAIGASTGGPNALQTILSKWPKDFPASVIIAQHISADFADPLAAWLSNHCQLTVRTARDGDRPQAGVVLVAGTDDHLVMRPDGVFIYTKDPIDNPFRPSVDVLFKSLARHWLRPSIAVLLTGIGQDGASGLLDLRRGGWHTIAQDQRTSVVYGMPQAASQLNAAVQVLPVGEIGIDIAARVKNLVHRKTVTGK